MRRLDELAALTADYEWLVGDGVLVGERPDYASALCSSNVTRRVLDCACATGAEAVALSRRGFRVLASDPSEAMAERARARVAEERAAIPIQVCSWASLDRCFDEPFDAVVCGGNSIVAAEGCEAMVHALEGMRRVTKLGGRLLLTSRNWEALRAWQPRVVLPGQWRRTGSTRKLAMYVWTVSKQWTQPHLLDVVVLHDGAERVTHRHHRLRYLPFRVKDLVNALRTAGYANVEIDYARSLEWYSVVARAI